MHCVTTNHVYCLYTLFKYRFSGKTVVKSVQLFAQNDQHCEKETVEEKLRKAFVELIPEN